MSEALEQVQDEEGLENDLDQSTDLNQEVEQQETVDPDLEARAREMGWSPKDQWRGDPDKHISAEEFVRRGEEVLPIVRAEKRKLEAELKEVRKATEELREFYANSEKRAYERAERELREKRKAAFDSGDAEAFEAADKEFEELVKPKPKQPQQQESNPTYDAWKERNAWVDNDPEAFDYANSVFPFILKQYSTLSYAQQLEKASEEVKRRFPEKFQNANRSRPPTVEGASRPGSKRGKSRTYADLPPEAKEQCDKFVRTIPGFKRDDYVKDFDWESIK